MNREQMVWAVVGGALLVVAFRVLTALWSALVARSPASQRLAQLKAQRRAKALDAARADRAAAIIAWAQTLNVRADGEDELALRREREQSGMPPDEILWWFFRSQWTQVVSEYVTSKGWTSVSVHACNQANNEQTIRALAALMYPSCAERVARGAIARYREYVEDFGPVGYEDRLAQ
jgi:hypothetical protein